jgi:hypothetical protein
MARNKRTRNETAAESKLPQLRQQQLLLPQL